MLYNVGINLEEYGSLAGGAISEKLGGSYELGTTIGNIVGGVAGSVTYSKIVSMKNISATTTSNKVGDFRGVRDLDDFKSRVPTDAKELPWKHVEGGAVEGLKYRWTDSNGDVWNVRAHSIDPSAPVGSNASKGWIYRVQVRYGNAGKRYYMDSEGLFHVENVLNPTSPLYNEKIANSTHIPFSRKP